MRNVYIMILLALSLVAMAIPVAAQNYGSIETLPAFTISLQNLDPSPAVAGETVEVRLAVENLGDAADNVVVEIVPDYPFEQVPGSNLVQNIGTLAKHQGGDIAKITKFQLRVNKDASASTYLLKVMVYEDGKRDSAISYTLPVDIKTRESAEIIYIDKTSLVPGEETALNFKINNVGKAPLTDLTFTWSNPEKVILPVGSDNTRHIPYLDIGESQNLAYTVVADPNANPGLYSLNLDLKYADTINNTVTDIATTAGVYVGGGTDFDVAFAQSSNGQTSFSIANIGSNTAYSVSVVVPAGQPGWLLTGPDTVILGNLNKGDYTVASYALSVPGMRNGTTGRGRGQTSTATTTPTTAPTRSFNATTTTNSITVEVAYTDTKGTRQVVDKTVRLSPQDLSSGSASTRIVATPSFWQTYQWYIIAAVVLVLAYFGYKAYRRRKAAAERKKK